MKKLKGMITLISLSIALFNGQVKAQLASVNKSTGAAVLNIPVYTIARGNIAVPISLIYYGNGVKVKDIEGSAGMNWQISAGGSITRELRDVADDLATNSLGWLYNTNATKINNFSISNDGNTATCTDENSDQTYIGNNFANLSDTEPDIFNINLPGLSCKLIFDGNHQPRTVPYKDIKVTFTTDLSGIKEFKIVNDNGLIYEFNISEGVARTASSSSPAAIKFFKRVYDVSQSSYFRRKWLLTSIKDKQNNEVTFGYERYQNDYRRTRKYYDFYLGNTSTKTSQFYVEDGAYTMMLTEINYMTDDILPYVPKFRFNYSYNANTYMPLLVGMSGMGRNWVLDYYDAFTSNLTYKRCFLKLFRETSMESTLRYSFNYYGLSTNGFTTTTTLPDSTSKQLDRWGYYNASTSSSLLPEVYINPLTPAMERLRYEQVPSLSANYPYYVSGNSRAVYADVLTTGSLSKVTLFDGGTTDIEYESNSYYDPQSNSNAYGGGVRVKSLKSYDSNLPSVQKQINYTYTNPSTGFTSGKAISLPIYAFIRSFPPTSNQETDWKNAVVRSDEELSESDEGIMYSFVKESIAGQGYTTNEFSLPATHFDLASTPDWNRVITNIAGCGGVPGKLNNGRDIYPFVPNMDIGFERGLPTKVSVYNEAGEKLTETTNTFGRTGIALYISAFRREYNNGVLSYAKYNLVTGVDKSIQQQQEITNNIASGQQQSSTASYFYQGIGHIYPTKTETLSGDGRLLRTTTKYSKDYDSSVANDSASLAIKSLVLKNINVPIETVNQVERSGIAKTVSANLVKYAVFSQGGEQPAKTLQFRNAAGVTNFQLSSILSGNFVSDSRYFPTKIFTDYSYYGQLLSESDGKGRFRSYLYDDVLRLPLANIINAKFDEVCVSNNEEGNYTGLWAESGGQASTTSQSGKYSVVTNSSIVLYKDLKKKAGSTMGVLSAWINSDVANTLNFSVTNSSNQVVSNSISVPATSGSWKYFQVRIPLSTMSVSYRLRMWGSSNMLIDDVVFHPEESSIDTKLYDYTTHNTLAASSANGIFAQYDYDGANRLKRIYNQDKDIVQKTSYISSFGQNQFAPTFTMEDNQTVNSPVYFSITSYPVTTGDGLTYTWNFGDGSPVVVTSSPNSVVHTYTQTGTFTASVTKSSPYYGSVTVNKSLILSQQQVSSTQLVSNSGDIALTFFNSSNQIVYQFSVSQMSAVNNTVSPGSYRVRVSTNSHSYSSSNPSSYKCISYFVQSPNTSYEPAGFITSQPNVAVYEFNINLTGRTKLMLYTSAQACDIPTVE